MKNPENCGYSEGVIHSHTEHCHQAGIQLGREQERGRILAWLHDQAALHHHAHGDAARRGALNHAADRLRDGRAPGRAEGTETTDG
ncbi:hypothetical protein [Nocardioides soli]|uniref:Uncharacterized protein n=1 Tax=Nocardioides soli TaxID=1036020 RepID=A0A7W4VTQ5_9ACTN|nr:hypothetical protein [Nocardioides soli]MBB3041187.1 hypothetical protein [Nocardioides soli]